MKFIYGLLFSVFLVFAVRGQVHFPNTMNFQTGIGVNDLGCVTPVIGVEYVFLNWVNLGARYTFGRKQLGIEANVWEHNLELINNYTPVNHNDKFFLNLGIGAGVKNTKMLNLPTPLYRAPVWNFGLMVNVELEFAFARYFSAFILSTPKFYFVDMKNRLRYELFWGAGVKTNLRWLKMLKNKKRGLRY